MLAARMGSIVNLVGIADHGSGGGWNCSWGIGSRGFLWAHVLLGEFSGGAENFAGWPGGMEC